jgi:hypothetical protein
MRAICTSSRRTSLRRSQNGAKYNFSLNPSFQRRPTLNKCSRWFHNIKCQKRPSKRCLSSKPLLIWIWPPHIFHRKSTRNVLRKPIWVSHWKSQLRLSIVGAKLTELLSNLKMRPKIWSKRWCLTLRTPTTSNRSSCCTRRVQKPKTRKGKRRWRGSCWQIRDFELMSYFKS